MSLPPRFYRGSATAQLATAVLAISSVREQLSGLATKGLLRRSSASRTSS